MTDPRNTARERGQMIVTVALLSVFLMILLAIVVETAFIYIQRRNLQNAADAAALAGAQLLPEDPGGAIADAKAWAAKNVEALTYNEAEVFDGNRAIRSVVRKPAATIFGDWFGYGGFEISAKAAARVAQPLLPGPGVVPLGITRAMYDEGCGDIDAEERCVLKQWAGNNDDPRSSYQLLAIDGPGQRLLEEGIRGGSVTGIEDPEDQQPGNMGRSLADGLQDRYEAAEGKCTTWDQVVNEDGSLIEDCNPMGKAGRNEDGVQPTMVVLIPVVKSFCQGSCDLDLVGDGDQPRTFAFFWIDYEETRCNAAPGQGGNRGPKANDDLPPGQCEIVGRFILDHQAHLTTPDGDPLADFDDNAVLKVVQLIE